ncbi:MAG: TIGR02206 family membrane protein [Bacteroidota bacterium]
MKTSIFESIFNYNNSFSNYGLEHFIIFLALTLFGFYLIYIAKTKWNEKQQKLFITLLCAFAAFTQLAKIPIKIYLGDFDAAADLPFHLCNIMPFALIYAMWKKDRKFFGIIFFWIMTGTFQSLITTTLSESLPNYESIRYWAVHGLISIAALYGVAVYGYRLTYKDAINSIIAIHFLAGAVFLVNMALNANYMFLNAKPEVTTMFDLLGPYPWYLLGMEPLAVILFGLILVPFYVLKCKSVTRK